MAFTTGTTLGSNAHNDLLSRLRTWLIGLTPPGDWTSEEWTAGAVDTDMARLHIRGPGAGASNRVFINIQTRNNPGDAAYGWAVSGATSYTAALPWGNQAGESSEVFLNLWAAAAIDYWFYANDRRFIVVAKVGASYCSLYAGFGLPFALPAEYPFPLYIGGQFHQLAPYNESNTRNRFFIDPGDQCAHYRLRGGAGWRKLANHYDGAGDVYVGGGTDTVMWPHRVPRAYQSVTEDWNKKGISAHRPNVLGEMPIYQCHIIDPASKEMPMALDGVYAAPGFNRASEQTFSIGGTTYRLFQNVGRQTERDFLAIAEV